MSSSYRDIQAKCSELRKKCLKNGWRRYRRRVRETTIPNRCVSRYTFIDHDPTPGVGSTRMFCRHRWPTSRLVATSTNHSQQGCCWHRWLNSGLMTGASSTNQSTLGCCRPRWHISILDGNSTNKFRRVCYHRGWRISSLQKNSTRRFRRTYYQRVWHISNAPYVTKSIYHRIWLISR